MGNKGSMGTALFSVVAITAHGQERREREPNSVYAERRAKLATLADSRSFFGVLPAAKRFLRPTSLSRKKNFYYLTGHNEEGAGLIIPSYWPEARHSKTFRAKLFSYRKEFAKGKNGTACACRRRIRASKPARDLRA